MKYIVTLNGKDYEVDVDELDEAVVRSVKDSAPAAPVAAAPAANNTQKAVEGEGTPVKSPMPGTILKVVANAGQSVKAGDVLIILESMKMENEVVAPASGTVNKVCVESGDNVATDEVLAFIS